MKFKFGDKVRTLKDVDKSGWEVFPAGTLGVITSVDENENRYMVNANDDWWFYDEDELEAVNDNDELSADEIAALLASVSPKEKKLAGIENDDDYKNRKIKEVMRSIENLVHHAYNCGYERGSQKTTCPVQTAEERAIDYLRKSGWLERHDKEIEDNARYNTELIDELKEQEYKRGYEDGKMAGGSPFDDVEEAREEGYKRGWKDAVEVHDYLLKDQEVEDEEKIRILCESHKSDEEAEYKRGVTDGRNEAWEALKWCAFECCETVDAVFGTNTDDELEEILTNFTASEAIEKIAAYEEKKKKEEKIAVGDEIEYDHGEHYKGVVLQVINIDGGGYKVLCENGCGQLLYKETANAKRTGRHFEQIAEVLEALKKEENECL